MVMAAIVCLHIMVKHVSIMFLNPNSRITLNAWSNFHNMDAAAVGGSTSDDVEVCSCQDQVYDDEAIGIANLEIYIRVDK